MHFLLMFTLISLMPDHAASAPAHAPDDIVGIWTDEKRLSHIEIKQSGDQYVGKIVWLREPNGPDGKPRLDVYNPDPAKQQRPVMGTTFLWGLTYKDGKYVGGSIYDFQRGQYADCAFRVQSDGKLQLTATKFLLTVTKYWTRIK